MAVSSRTSLTLRYWLKRHLGVVEVSKYVGELSRIFGVGTLDNEVFRCSWNSSRRARQLLESPEDVCLAARPGIGKSCAVLKSQIGNGLLLFSTFL